MRRDPGTGRKLAIINYGSTPTDDEPQEPEANDEPKPKRRSAFSHAFSGFTLLVCIGVSMWLLEQAGWTDLEGTWRRTQTRFTLGRQGFRDQIKVRMVQAEVHQLIGTGVKRSVGPGVMVEDYSEGFRVVYRVLDLGYTEFWEVTGVEDLP